MYTYGDSQIEALEFSFQQMHDAGWDTDGDLLWGYFFVDRDVQTKRLSEHLKSLDYRYVDIFELEDEHKSLPANTCCMLRELRFITQILLLKETWHSRSSPLKVVLPHMMAGMPGK